LIAALKDKDSSVRSGASSALGSIKDVRAVEPLIAALKDEDSSVRSGAAGALGSIKDARAVEPLMAALKDENLEIIAGAYSFFIQKGASGSEALLIKALDKYGTRTLWMAQDFLSCGNDLLVEAVKNWARKYGYIIHASPVTHSGPIWGR
jgi:HEAT repeat protein